MRCAQSRMLPNWAFNMDAEAGHAFGILMASSGTLRATRSGAS